MPFVSRFCVKDAKALGPRHGLLEPMAQTLSHLRRGYLATGKRKASAVPGPGKRPGGNRSCEGKGKGRVERVEEELSHRLGQGPGGAEVDGERLDHRADGQEPEEDERRHGEPAEAQAASKRDRERNRQGGEESRQGQVSVRDLEAGIERIALDEIVAGDAEERVGPERPGGGSPESVYGRGAVRATSSARPDAGSSGR